MVDRFRRLSGWNIAGGLIALLAMLPVLSVVWLALFPARNIWPHLLATTLPVYLANSLVLAATVGAVTAFVGTSAAWLVVMTAFPGRRWLEWALLIPLALPAYISAYALSDFMDYAGPLQSLMRQVFGWTDARDYWFPHFRSIGGAIIVLSMAHFPYVYILARAAFRQQSASISDAARSLGAGPGAVFRKVALPMARPAIAAGTAIAMMEVLGDFGAVDYFAVPTLATGVFSTWLQANNAGGAAQIACVMLGLILLLVVAERTARKQQRFYPLAQGGRPAELLRLRGSAGWAAAAFCILPVLLGFAGPVAVLVAHAAGESWLDSDLLRAVWHSFALAGTAAVLTVAAGLVLVYALRQSAGGLNRFLPLTALGYAAPGAVLALGIMLPLAAFDNAVASAMQAAFGINTGLLLTGTAAALVLAYGVRFFAVAQNTLDAALGRVSPAMDMASRTLGQGPGGTLRRVHLPIIRGSVLVAGLLVFVDTAKELPATLILRPFNFETLATLAYNQASLEDIGGAAPSALVVTLVGLVPVLLLARATRHGWNRL